MSNSNEMRMFCGCVEAAKEERKEEKRNNKGFVWAWLGFGPAEKEEKENERVRLVC